MHFNWICDDTASISGPHWNIQHRLSSTFRFTVGGDNFRLALGFGEELLDFAPGNVQHVYLGRIWDIMYIGWYLSGISILIYLGYLSGYLFYDIFFCIFLDIMFIIATVSETHTWFVYLSMVSISQNGHDPMLCGEKNNMFVCMQTVSYTKSPVLFPKNPEEDTPTKSGTKPFLFKLNSSGFITQGSVLENQLVNTPPSAVGVGWHIYILTGSRHRDVQCHQPNFEPILFRQQKCLILFFDWYSLISNATTIMCISLCMFYMAKKHL